MSICPKCGHHTPTTNENLRGMFAARVEKPAKVNNRSLEAAHNEMATAMHAINAEDVIDPRSACVEPRRAVDTEDAPVVKLGQGDYSAEWFARGLGLRSGGVQ